MSTYLTVEQIADRLVTLDYNIFDQRVTDEGLVISANGVDLHTAKFEDGVQYLVQHVPFQYFDDYPIDEDDEDYAIAFDEYLDDESVPECVFINGFIVVLSGKCE